MKQKLLPKKVILVASLLATGIAAQAEVTKVRNPHPTSTTIQASTLSQEQLQQSEFSCGVSCGVSCGHTVS